MILKFHDIFNEHYQSILSDLLVQGLRVQLKKEGGKRFYDGLLYHKHDVTHKTNTDFLFVSFDRTFGGHEAATYKVWSSIIPDDLGLYKNGGSWHPDYGVEMIILKNVIDLEYDDDDCI